MTTGARQPTSTHRRTWVPGTLIAIAVIAAIVVALVLRPWEAPAAEAGTLEVAAGRDATLTSPDGGVTVTIPGDAIEGSGTLNVASLDAEELREGWSIDLARGASLVGEAELRFHDVTLEADEPLPLVTFEQDDGTVGHAEHVTLDGTDLVVRTTHLSDWFTSTWSHLRDAISDALDRLMSPVAAGAHPTCEGEQEVRDAGYEVTSSDGPRVLWCFGMQDGQPVLRATNGRGFAVTAEHSPGLAVTGEDPMALREWAQHLLRDAPTLGGNETTLLGAAETIELAVAGRTEMAVRFRPSPGAYLVDAAAFAAETVGLMLTFMGAKGTTAQQIETALDLGSCFAAGSSVMTAEIDTPTAAQGFLEDALSMALDCSAAAAPRLLEGSAAIVATPLVWVVSGVRTFVGGIVAAADTMLDPFGYWVSIAPPGPPVAEGRYELADGVPDALLGEWCETRSTDACIDFEAVAREYPDAYLDVTNEDLGDSHGFVEGTSRVRLCYNVTDVGGGCIMAEQGTFDLFPAGVEYDCEAIAQAGGWQYCLGGFQGEHRTDEDRLVPLVNHFHQEDQHGYPELAPRYRR